MLKYKYPIGWTFLLERWPITEFCIQYRHGRVEVWKWIKTRTWFTWQLAMLVPRPVSPSLDPKLHHAEIHYYLTSLLFVNWFVSMIRRVCCAVQLLLKHVLSLSKANVILLSLPFLKIPYIRGRNKYICVSNMYMSGVGIWVVIIWNFSHVQAITHFMSQRYHSKNIICM